MSSGVYRFVFADGVSMHGVEQTLLLAIVGAGSLHGEPAIRLDAGYTTDPEKRTVVIDASTPVGSAVTRLFAGYCAKELGDGAFRVERAVPAVVPLSVVGEAA